jgi:hypothetical protein
MIPRETSTVLNQRLASTVDSYPARAGVKSLRHSVRAVALLPSAGSRKRLVEALPTRRFTRLQIANLDARSLQ